MENKISEIIHASLAEVKSFASVETITGNAITTPSGVTVIPISKITIGFASGGVDYASKGSPPQNFGGGGGTGISITPVAFLTINERSDIKLIPVADSGVGIDRIVSLIERSPEIIEKIKGAMS